MRTRFISASQVGRSILAVTAAGLISMALPALAQEDSYWSEAAESQSDSAVSQETLDGLLAPIALYPDALLAQVLMASTYPVDVLEAARWQQENSGLSGQALQDALDSFDWDPSVKSLVTVPQVLQYMNDSPQWMQALGHAVMEDQPRVMASVQALRRKARTAGTLTSNNRQAVGVDMDPAARIEYITITPVERQVVYVPAYDPCIVYGTWWWPSSPVCWRPPVGVLLTSGFYWSNRHYPSAALWGGFNWRGRRMIVDAPAYRRYYRSPPRVRPGNVWRPSPAYRHPGAAGRHRPYRPVMQRPGRSSEQRLIRPSDQRSARPSMRPPEQRLMRPSERRSMRLPEQRGARPSEQRSVRSPGQRVARPVEQRSMRLPEQRVARSSEQRSMRPPEHRVVRSPEPRPAVRAQPSRPSARSFGRTEARVQRERPRESSRPSSRGASGRDSSRGDGRSARR